MPIQSLALSLLKQLLKNINENILKKAVDQGLLKMNGDRVKAVYKKVKK